jgi:hypothetical protein
MYELSRKWPWPLWLYAHVLQGVAPKFHTHVEVFSKYQRTGNPANYLNSVRNVSVITIQGNDTTYFNITKVNWKNFFHWFNSGSPLSTYCISEKTSEGITLWETKSCISVKISKIKWQLERNWSNMLILSQNEVIGSALCKGNYYGN